MVPATISFIKPLDLYKTVKPYFLDIPNKENLAGLPVTNLQFATQPGIAIEDIRQAGLRAFSLDKNGFEVIGDDTIFSREMSYDEIEKYCNKIVHLMAKRCDAVHTICYDYRIRKMNTSSTDYYGNSQNSARTKAAPPAFAAHIDHTVEGGRNRVRRHFLPDEVAIYMNDKFRIRIINFWRPLWNTVEDCPLAICDPRSIDAKHDLMAADRVNLDFPVELYYLKHNPSQKWYWLRQHATHELLAFTNYDSWCEVEGTNWNCCPHAAFLNADALDEAPPRETIEIRLIVVTNSS